MCKYNVLNVPGKTNIADPFYFLFTDHTEANPFDDEIEGYVICERKHFTFITARRTHVNNKGGIKDDDITLVHKAIQNNIWPTDVIAYKIIQKELSEADGFILRGTHLIISQSLRSQCYHYRTKDTRE